MSPRSGRPQKAAFVALLLAAAAARAEAPAPDIAAAGLEGSAVTAVPAASGVSVPPEPVKPAARPDEKADADADDPESQAEVDKGAAELEEVRKAEEKAGLLPQAPGAGPRDGLAIGLDSWDPLARDLAAAQGTSIDGAPLADPAPSGIELRAKYDIPVELNDAVVAYIRFFQTDGRVHFTKWLGRSTRFMPMMRGLLEKQGLPLDLVYLSMIESGFSTYAYSFAKAAGLWQFVVGTSRRYGLHTDFWVDERRDPIKATIAAARYRRESTRDFWRMMSKGRTLRAETKHYVPKLIAAALIAKHPERFGFKVAYAEPWEADEFYIADATDLHVIAKTAGITIDEVRDLNPELRRFCTPPGGWTIRLPKGKKEAFVADFEKLDAGERLSFTEHKVERGERLSKIARAYGVSEGAILRTNGLKSYRQVKVGRVLVIPMKQSSRGLLAGSQLEDRRTPRLQGRSAAKTVAAATAASVRVNEDGRRQTYVVKAGDTLWSIASKFSTTVDRLKRLNNLTGRRARDLHVGQRLAVKDTES